MQEAEPPPLGELLALFARFAAISEEAFQALETDDAEELARLMEQREALLAQAAPLLREAHLLRQRSEALSGDEEGVLQAVVLAGKALVEIDRRLLAEAGLLRKQISGELRQMGRAAAARSAYASPSPPSPPR